MKLTISIIALIIIVNSTLSFSQVAYSVSGNPEITIAGTSNVHDWEEKVETFNGSGTVIWNTDGSFNLTSLTVEVDCKAIKSSHGSIMDNKTYDALKAEKYPIIIYKLTSPLNNVKPSASGITINTAGEITIAGVTKPVNLQVKVTSSSNGQLLFEGAKAINMTEFNVSPPTAFMGAMKVGDVVTVSFKSNFSKSQTSMLIK